MPKIASISSFTPPYKLQQTSIEKLTSELFQEKMPQLNRLLKVFSNGEIDNRNFCVPTEWYKEDHSFEERNNLYIELAIQYSVEAIQRCLNNAHFLHAPISTEEIDAFIFVSSSGIATPSIDARVMNVLPFSDRMKRLPLWGLGCGGGAAGISRAFDYCKAHPAAKVLVVSVELSSLTFQKNDYSKSNLIGASLFADGAAAVLVCGEDVAIPTKKALPSIIGTASKWMPKSENIMGWDVQNDGLHVIFNKNIPSIVSTWLAPFVHEFLHEQNVELKDISYFIAHPGGKKVLQAYEQALNINRDHTNISRTILKNHGNMSSPTVLYALEQFMLQKNETDKLGLLFALGPGFSGEVVLLEWRD